MFERVALSSVTYNLESLDIERIVVKRLAIGPLGRCLIDGDMISNVTYIVWHIHILDTENPKSVLALAWARLCSMKEFALVVGLSEHFGMVGHNAESTWKKIS